MRAGYALEYKGAHGEVAQDVEEATTVIAIRMRAHDIVEVRNTLRTQEGRDDTPAAIAKLALVATVDQHGAARRTPHKNGVAVTDVDDVHPAGLPPRRPEHQRKRRASCCRNPFASRAAHTR